MCTARRCWCIPEVACRNNNKETVTVPHPAAFSLRSQVFQLLTRIPCILRNAKVLKLSFHFSLAILYAPFHSVFQLKLLCISHFSHSPLSPHNFSMALSNFWNFFRLPAIKMKHVFRYALGASGSFHHLRYHFITNIKILQESE